ncbi:hypothetical protein SE91_22250 [Bradyrhizobium sp. DOA1]|nr:hypothetical protein SE91_22250 [Bradyrhizobium sp. DOA1]
MLEFGEIFGRDEYEKPEQHHCGDVQAHAGAIRSAAIFLELREIEYAKNVVGPHIIGRSSAGL